MLHTSISVVSEYATEETETDNFSEYLFFFSFLINNFLVQEKNKSQKRTGRTTLHLLYKRTFSKTETTYVVHHYVKPYHNNLGFYNIYSTTSHAQLPNISYKGGGGVL